jgi:hypothetical protein
MNWNLPILIFVWIFVAVLLFSVFNTAIAGFVKPVFNATAHSSGFVNVTTYETKEAMIMNVFYIVLGIMVIAPFAYIAVRLFFKREPEPYERGFN